MKEIRKMENSISITPRLRLQRVEERSVQMNPKVFGKKIGIFATLFGCRHKDLSKPFSREKTAYRTCLDCGSMKPFDPKTLKTLDGFYHPPIIRKIRC